MYLLVFVTLVIGLVGIYAQVLSLQAARIASSINALGTNMVEWHLAAISMGGSILQTNLPASIPVTVPCSLTFTAPAGVTACIPPVGSGDASGTVTVGATSGLNNIVIGNPPITVPVHLPADYKIAQVQFYSILYKDASSNQYYVVTYVPPAHISANNPAPGFLSLPTSSNYISYTSSDLQHQLSISHIPDYAYGTAASNGTNEFLVSPAYEKGEVYATSTGGVKTVIQYNLPAVVPTGSVAIVSTASGF